MIVEKFFYKKHTPSHQRRPIGHSNRRGETKKGNTKRGMRQRPASLSEEEGELEEDEEDDTEDLRRWILLC